MNSVCNICFVFYSILFYCELFIDLIYVWSIGYIVKENNNNNNNKYKWRDYTILKINH